MELNEYFNEDYYPEIAKAERDNCAWQDMAEELGIDAECEEDVFNSNEG